MAERGARRGRGGRMGWKKANWEMTSISNTLETGLELLPLLCMEGDHVKR